MSASTTATPIAAPADDRREQIGWYFYDWANSAFSTTVVTVFLGPYLTSLARAAADAQGFVYPLFFPIAADSFFAYMVGLSVFLQVFFLPILGAIADYSNAKKPMLAFFAFTGALATICLFVVQGDSYLLGGLLFLVANLAFGASMVFYNAFLPEIASPERRDTVSSQGWALGYLGGGLLLVANLVLYLNYERIGISEGFAVRVSMASAGVWWALFTIIPLLTLKSRRPRKQLPAGSNYLTAGFRQLGHTFRQMRHYPHTLLFLAAYLLYNDGIQAVIALSSQFAEFELGLGQSVRIGAILLVQFVAFFGALAFGLLARRIGAKQAILLSLVVWTGTVIYGYFMPAGVPLQFFGLAAVIALVLGGSQAISRSIFSLMIPKGQEAEYFSLYEVSERGTSWLAPVFFGLALQFTGSYRIAIVSLMIFFIAGFILLTRVDIRRAVTDVGNEAPAHM